MFGYYILIGAIALVSWLVSNQLKRKFAKYSKVQLRNGLTGREWKDVSSGEKWNVEDTFCCLACRDLFCIKKHDNDKGV